MHRLSDQDARNGDVTDICISIEGEGDVNLSLKHNHDALKHQRPLSAAQWIGLPRKSNEDLQHRRAMANAVTCFLEKAEIACPGAILFTDVDAKDPTACALLSAEIIDEVLDTFREHSFAISLFEQLIANQDEFSLDALRSNDLECLLRDSTYEGVFHVNPTRESHAIGSEAGSNYWSAADYNFVSKDSNGNDIVK